jgi:FkbM family methyltransferase
MMVIARPKDLNQVVRRAKAGVKAKLRDRLVKLANSNIYLYALVRYHLGRMRLFLPHEVDFAAVKLLPIGHDEIFLDVGANDGLSALSFRVFNETTPILSVEANPCHANMLEGVKRRIKSFQYLLVGAGDEEKSITLLTPHYKSIALTSYSSFNEEAARQNLAEHVYIRDIGEKVVFSSAKVRIIRLDDLNLRPGFIKIDVEGAEDAVLRGLAMTLLHQKPSLLVERNPGNFSAVQKALGELQYESFIYDATLRKFERYAGQGSLNVFFLHPQRFVPNTAS